MNNQPDAFFFEIQPIPDDTILFHQFKEQKIFFSYFQVDQKYYLFFYSQKSIDIDLIDPSIHILEELNTKQRKIRSLRGFFLYALEIIDNGKDLKILTTNLKSSFWRNLRTILRQNKKQVLLQFLFGTAYTSYSFEAFEDRIQTFQNQLDSLETALRFEQQKRIQLENNQTLEIQTAVASALRQLLKPSQASKLDQQGNSTMKSEHSPHSANLLGNESEVNLEVQEPRHPISESLLKASQSSFKTSEQSEQYNIPSEQDKALNKPGGLLRLPNLITLSKISEQEKIEIIQRGFQLQAQETISLKKYYESKDPNSLFQLKGYSIKYESIRRTSLYKSLKE